MIYLLSQILLCLALAALLGGALGWLLHRSRNNARLDDLHDALELRDRDLERARGDAAMLSDDFEDLRERSRVEIDALRLDNERLPALTDNLEKSQLLVRQMIQRHDAQTRELSSANAVLDGRLAQLQEQVVARERELVALRAGRNPDEAVARHGTDGRGKVTAPAAPGDDALPASVVSAVTEDGGRAGDGETRSDRDPDGRRDRPSSPLDAAATATPAGTSTGPAADPPVGAARREVGAAAPLDETMDEVMEVDESLAAELLGDASVDERRPGPATIAIDAGTHATTGDIGPADGDDGAGVHEEDGWDEDDEEDGNATLAIDVSMIEGLEDGDGADRAARPLFRPVARQDDLKRIFGITPLTEKALNELGITSYPQLAELERPEIEKIARALEIVPETIERDDWVGNARRQLEDVLEQL